MRGVVFSTSDAMARRAFQVWKRRGGLVSGKVCMLVGPGPHETRPHMLAIYPEDVFAFRTNRLTGKVALVVLAVEDEPVEADELGSDWE